MFKNLFKNIVFLEFSGSVLEPKREFGVRMVKLVCSYHSRTNSKNSHSKPWEIENFSSLVSLKSGRPIPIKIIFSKLTRIDLLSHKV